MRRVFVLLTVAALVGVFPGSAVADDKDRLRAVPFTFVGTAAECAPSPAGSRIVTAAWLGGMGLPDSGGDTALNGTPATRNDPHSGLLLNKNGPTADCSSSGARIEGVRGMTVTATTALGFDYRSGTHCGAGAPRFNVDTDMGFFFVGCINGTQTPAPQDTANWTRTRSVLSACGPACFPSSIPVGARINSISILYDEGTDNPVGTSDPVGVGLAVIDNIYIDGRTITSGKGVQDGGKDKKDKDGDDDEDEEDDEDDD